ncbi:hypothetical protein L1787_04765 [Acuticoccus sp. M5D2P5]|uniref:hypothetical protein n=1 Tax=Acuticoccus kalidii TaxID=2910977 RepID=UPI001F2BBCC6|nr:hypothetical protein [Acuticoccus kalidii]MCF3932727.1 hypothetical protein [Acuticoccus kalidii]
MSLRLSVNVAVLVSAGALLAACQSGGSGSPAAPSSTVRQTVVTAPADLQLICASEAATRFSVASNAVLPVSSQQVENGQYRVDLTVDSGRAVCVVDDNANIVSLERA